MILSRYIQRKIDNLAFDIAEEWCDEEGVTDEVGTEVNVELEDAISEAVSDVLERHLP